MAQVLSGSFNTTAYSGRYLTLSWTATQDIAKNQSTISWSLKGAGSASGYYMAGNFKVVIDGATVYESSGRIQLWNGTNVASGTKTITHTSTGSRSFSASAQAGIYTNAVNCSGSNSWELKSIPRAATISSAPNFNDEEKPKVVFSNPAGNAVDSLSIGIGTANNSANLVDYKTLSKTATEYTFTFTSAEQQKLWGAVKTGLSTTVYFILKTVISGTTYTNHVAKTLTLINATPTVSPTVIDTGANSTTITGDSSKIISGYNAAKATINAAARKGATIKTVWIRNGDSNFGEGSTGNFTYSFPYTTNGNFYFNAEDSRGNRLLNAPYHVEKDLIPWFKPSITFVRNNMSTGGAYTISAKGSFYNGSLGATTNTLTVQYNWRTSGGSWSGWTNMTVSKSGNTYTASASKSGLDYQTTYEVQIRAYDAIGAKSGDYYATTNIESVSSIPVFDWGKNDFRHNTHTMFANNKFIYGTSPDGEYINALEPCNDNNNCVLGYGGYTNEIGATHIYGDKIRLYSNNGIVIDGNILADFVVEQGTSGIWYYRKWNSGRAECWGSVSVNTAVTTAWGSMYAGATKMSRQNYPFTFTSQPIEMASVRTASNAVWVFAESGSVGTNTTTQSAVYNICRPSQITASSNYHICLHVSGRWK